MIYLVFNEGYAATDGETLTRPDLCAEAVRLGRLVVGLLDEPEAQGLLALMLLHEARPRRYMSSPERCLAVSFFIREPVRFPSACSQASPILLIKSRAELVRYYLQRAARRRVVIQLVTE